MIHVQRGKEPKELKTVRNRELLVLRSLGRMPTSDEIKGYRVVSEDLWRKQHYKCCYCEQKIRKSYNDVEHYRPKARANRQPGCHADHGYWWLSFTWNNLLFACPSCNRSEKNDMFPLTIGDTALIAEQTAPGREHALLIDPGGSVNPVEHIRFVFVQVGPAGSPKFWLARPRNSSLLGSWTINVCGLNEGELLELRGDHVERAVRPQAEAIIEAIVAADLGRIDREFERALSMLAPTAPYVALTYDAFLHFLPDTAMGPWGKGWPSPALVGMP